MSVTESRIKSGTLTLGEFAASCQPTNVKITPSYKDDGDPVETLCGDLLAPDTTRTDTLAITAIQDFADPAGFQAWTWEHDLETVLFTWKPQGATGPTYTGEVQVRATEVGGDVNKRLSHDVSWACTGKSTVTYPAGG